MKSALTPIVTAGAAAGALDISYAIIVYGSVGVSPVRILQSIASGVLGPAAYEGGAASAVLGGVLHFAIATAMAAAYFIVSGRWPGIRATPFRTGFFYGMFLFAVMYFVVVPLSASPVTTPSGWLLVGALFAHTVLVGIPIAIVIRYLAPGRRDAGARRH